MSKMSVKEAREIVSLEEAGESFTWKQITRAARVLADEYETWKTVAECSQAERDRLSEDLEASRRRVRELEAIVGKMPKTADGVPVCECNVLYFVHPEVDHILRCREYAVDMFVEVAFVQYQGAQYRVDLMCYPTRDAALAAKEPTQ